MVRNLFKVSTDLTRALQEIHYIKIDNFLEENSGEWMALKRKLPLSSNMRGVWECQIWSTRVILNSKRKTHGSSLSDEALQTLLVEVEAIINSHPLTDVLECHKPSYSNSIKTFYNEVKSFDATSR